MKSKSTEILIIFLILAVLPICAQAAQDRASVRQQRIAQAYAADRAELYRLAEIYARRLSADERLLWIGFMKQKCSPCTDTYSLYHPFTRLSILKGHERRLRGDMMENYSLRNFAKLLMDDKAYHILNEVADSGVQGVSLRRKALELLAIMDQLQARALEIEAHRDSELAKLESWRPYANRIEFEEPAPAKVQLPAQQLGLVSAISYGGDSSLCMVEGVDEILTLGDIISTDQVRDVKIVGISQNAVEFQKNSRTWAQALGQAPDAVWTK